MSKTGGHHSSKDDVPGLLGGAYPGMMMTGSGGFGSTLQAEHRLAEEVCAQADQARHHGDSLHPRRCWPVMDYHVDETDGDSRIRRGGHRREVRAAALHIGPSNRHRRPMSK